MKLSEAFKCKRLNFSAKIIKALRRLDPKSEGKFFKDSTIIEEIREKSTVSVKEEQKVRRDLKKMAESGKLCMQNDKFKLGPKYVAKHALRKAKLRLPDLSADERLLLRFIRRYPSSELCKETLDAKPHLKEWAEFLNTLPEKDPAIIKDEGGHTSSVPEHGDLCNQGQSDPLKLQDDVRDNDDTCNEKRSINGIDEQIATEYDELLKALERLKSLLQKHLELDDEMDEN